MNLSHKSKFHLNALGAAFLIPFVGIYGAIAGTLVYQVFVFAVETAFVFKYVKLKLPIVKNFLKPLLASLLMGAAVFGSYKAISGFLGNSVSTVIAVAVGMITYGAFVLLLRTVKEEDFSTLPMGAKIGKLLKKLHLV